MVEIHKHNGTDTPRIDQRDIIGPSLQTATFQVSARSVQPSIVQRGSATLAAGVKLVTFPQAYSDSTDLVVVLGPRTNNPVFIDSLVTSAFTVSGSGTDSVYWLACGYK